jgi:hypothetical protein
MQSYKNIGYLLCSFFLGLFYLLLLVPGICLGIGTLIIWLGVPILFAVMWLWWQFTALERSMAISWLAVAIAPMNIAPPRSRGWWQRVSVAFKQFHDLEDTGLPAAEVSARHLFI